MHKHLTLVFATLALSAAAFAQDTNIFQDGWYQVGYAANLNIGDSVVNLSNDGVKGGFYTGKNAGTICANVYVFDAAEEEISCCYCLITPNGLNSLSAKSDLISNTLTPAVPSSIVIKLVGSTQKTTGGCDPTAVSALAPGAPGNNVTVGLLAWGATLEPAGSPNTFGVINVPFLNAHLSHNPLPGQPNELGDLASVCAFVQAEGSGFGVCKSCRLGALSGSKN